MSQYEEYADLGEVIDLAGMSLDNAITANNMGKEPLDGCGIPDYHLSDTEVSGTVYVDRVP